MLTQADVDYLVSQGLNPNEYDVDATGDNFVPKSTISQPAVNNTEFLHPKISTKPDVFSPAGTAAGTFAHGAPSAIAGGFGFAKGMQFGARLPIPHPLGRAAASLGAGVLGGLGVGGVTRAAQNQVEKPFINEAAELALNPTGIPGSNPMAAIGQFLLKLQASQEANPKSAIAGEIATMPLAGMNPSPTRTLKAAQYGIPWLLGHRPPVEQIPNIMNVGVGAALQPAIGVGQRLATGEPIEAKDLALETLLGAVFNRPNVIGKKFGFSDTQIESPHPTRAQLAPEEILQAIQTMPPMTPTEVAVTGGASPLKGVRQVRQATEKMSAAYRPADYMQQRGYKESVEVTPEELARMEAEGGPVMEEPTTRLEEFMAAMQELRERPVRVANPPAPKPTVKEREQLRMRLGAKATPEAIMARGIPTVETIPAGARQEPVFETMPPGRTEADIYQEQLESSPRAKRFMQEETPLGPRPRTKFEQEIAEKVEVSGAPVKPTVAWKQMLDNWGLSQRNVTVKEDGSIVNEKGQSIAGQAFIKPGVQEAAERVASINPAKEGLDTRAHELMHFFVNDLRDSPKAYDRLLVSRFEKLVGTSPEFQQINKARIAEGRKPWDAEEFIVSEQGSQYLNRQLGLSGEKPMQIWWRDFSAHLKTRYGKDATDADYRRLLNYRFQNDPAFSQYFAKGAKAGLEGGRVLEQQSEDSSLNKPKAPIDNPVIMERVNEAITGLKDGTVLTDDVRELKLALLDEVELPVKLRAALDNVDAGSMTSWIQFRAALKNAIEGKDFALPKESVPNFVKEAKPAAPKPVTPKPVAQAKTAYVEPNPVKPLKGDALTKKAPTADEVKMADAEWQEIDSTENPYQLAQKIRNKHNAATDRDRRVRLATQYNYLIDKHKLDYLGPIVRASEESSLERPVTIRKADGTEYEAFFADKYWDWPGRGKVASIAKLTESGERTHSALAPDETMIERQSDESSLNERAPIKSNQAFAKNVNAVSDIMSRLKNAKTIVSINNAGDFGRAGIQADSWQEGFNKLEQKYPPGRYRVEQHNGAIYVYDDYPKSLFSDESSVGESFQQQARKASEDTITAAQDYDPFFDSPEETQRIGQRVNEAGAFLNPKRNSDESIFSKIKHPEFGTVENWYDKTISPRVRFIDELLSTGNLEEARKTYSNIHLKVLSEEGVTFEELKARAGDLLSDEQIRNDLEFGQISRDYALERLKSIEEKLFGKFSDESSIYATKLGKLLTKTVAPEIEAIRQHSPEGKVAAAGLDKFYEDMSQLRGQLEQRLIRNLWKTRRSTNLKEFWQQDNEDFRAVVKWLDLKQDGKEPSFTLTDKQKEIESAVRENLKASYEMRESRPELAHETSSAPFYLPHTMSRDAATELSDNPGSDKSMGYYRDFLKYQKEVNGLSLDEAKNAWKTVRGAFTKESHNLAQQFGPIDKASGIGLPISMREQNLMDRMSRFNRRFARRIAYHDAIEKNPEVSEALFNKEKGLESTQATKNVLEDIYGVREHIEAKRSAALGVVRAGMLGPLTGAKDFTANLTLGMQHQDLGQVAPALASAFRDFKANYERAIDKGSVRYNISGLEMGDGGFKNAVGMLHRLRDVINTVQGRQALETATRIVAFGQGRYLAIDALSALRAKNLSFQKTKFLKDFVPEWEKFRDAAATEETINKAAAKYVDSVQGTYDYRGQPALTMRGTFAPVLSLARWNVEKFNNFVKHNVDPARQGNWKPLLMSTLGMLIGGTAVTALVEAATGRKERTPTLKEVAAAKDENKIKLAAYKLAGLSSMSGYGGMMADLFKTIMDKQFKNRPQIYNNPLIDGIATAVENTEFLVEAMQNGDIPGFADVTNQILQDYFQAYRLGVAHLSPEKKAEAEKRSKLRDMKMFKAGEGLPLSPYSSERPNPYTDRDMKQFKKTDDIGEAVELLPGLLQKAFDKAGQDPERLKSELLKLKLHNYQTMPNPRTLPRRFYDYYLWLEETQGKEEASARLMDYLQQNAIDEAKAKLVP